MTDAVLAAKVTLVTVAPPDEAANSFVPVDVDESVTAEAVDLVVEFP